MGVRSLDSFVNKIDGLRKSYELHDTKLVIDGNNLLSHLYVKYNDSRDDFLFGGNYADYIPLFEIFFHNLQKCRIEPFIVFDGGLNANLNESRLSRFEEALSRSERISHLKHSKDDVSIPLLLRKTFESVIEKCIAKEWPIIAFQTSFDADLDSAKLANVLKCPLLSNDSDFLVINIEFGVISCDSFLWKSPQLLNNLKNNKKVDKKYCIECKLYKIDDFVDKFNGLKKEMLPIFATLMGNDFIGHEIFEEFYAQIPNYHMIEGMEGMETHERWHRMNQTLMWLRNFFTSKQAILCINEYIKSEEQINLFEISLKSYETGDNETFLTKLLNYRINKLETNDIVIEDIFHDLIQNNNNNNSNNNNQIPNWFLIEFHCNTNLNKLLMSLIKTKFVIFKPLIEDFSLQSCLDCSQDLLELIYGLLRTDSEDSISATIVSRNGSQRQEIEIIPKRYLNGGLEELPVLSGIRNLSLIERKDLMLKLLNSNNEMITDFAHTFNNRYLRTNEDIEFWTYLVLIIRYWMQKTKNENAYAFIRALVLSIIYYKFSVDYAEKNFKRLTLIDTNHTKFTFKPCLVHYYCEFQYCYSFIDMLSGLLAHPLSCCQLHEYMNGILIYNLFDEKSLMFDSRQLNSIYWIVLGFIDF